MKKMLNTKISCSSCVSSFLNDEGLEKSTIKSGLPRDTKMTSFNSKGKNKKSVKITTLF